MKRVTIGLELDESFIRLLDANVGLSGGYRPEKELDVAGVLARVVAMEARGGTEEQVHSIIQPKWRPHIAAVSSMRKVEET